MKRNKNKRSLRTTPYSFLKNEIKVGYYYWMYVQWENYRIDKKDKNSEHTIQKQHYDH